MIYDKLVQHFEKINQLEKPQIIVSVASPEGQIEILDFFYKRQMIKGEDYFFFT